MPTSDAWGKDWVKHSLITMDEFFDFKNVLDVGAGEGTYLNLLGLDIGRTWTAIEAWAPYVYQYRLLDKYNGVVISDIREYSSLIEAHDLVIFGDVLEHMSKADARHLISQSFGTTVICIPVLHLEQGDVNGNPYEVHRMENHWTADEMRAMLREVADTFDGPYMIDEHIGDVVAYFIMYPYTKDQW
jgi:hypothetical protein